MRFTIQLDLSGAAFEDNREAEAQQLANGIAEQLRRSLLAQTAPGWRSWMRGDSFVYDSNGNRAGTITPEAAD